MLIHTKVTLKTLKGGDIKNNDTLFTVGDALSEILATAKEGGKAKLYVLAQKFATQDNVEVDAADLSLIKKTVEACTNYVPLVTGQLLILLDEIK